MKHTTRILITLGVAASATLVVVWPGVASAGPRGVFRGTHVTVAPAPTGTTGDTASPDVATTSAPTTTSVSVPAAAPAGQPSDPTCSPATLTFVRQKVESELSGRVTQLNALLSAVNQSNQLTAPDRATLQGDISTVELPGITALQPQVQGAVTCAQVRGFATTMVLSYRVYLVMTPQTHLTIAADDETSIESEFVALEPGIATAIQRAQARGENVAAATAADSDLVNQVAAASTATNGLSVQLLAQTPQGSPGNWSVFEAAGQATGRADRALHAAATDAQEIKTDLS